MGVQDATFELVDSKQLLAEKMHRMRLTSEDREVAVANFEQKEFKRQQSKWLQYYQSKATGPQKPSEEFLPVPKEPTQFNPFNLRAYQPRRQDNLHLRHLDDEYC